MTCLALRIALQCWVNYFLNVIFTITSYYREKVIFLLYLLQKPKSNMLQLQLLFKSNEITYLLHSLLSCQV